MSTESRPDSLARHLLTMQIIAAALHAGVVIFGLIAMVMGNSQEAADPFLAYVAAGFAFLMTAMRFVIPSVVVQSQLARLQDGADQNRERGEALAMAYQTKMIVELALLEGAAFFNLVIYLVEAQMTSLVVAAGLLLLMTASFPTRSKLENWIADQRQILALE